MNPDKKDKIRAAISHGEHAEATLKRLDWAFVELREDCRSALVHSVRTKAGDAEILAGAYEFAALENVYEKFYQKVVSGRKAQKAATRLEESEAMK